MAERRNPFEALLAPRSVAVIGASDDVARIGGRPLRYMREGGFAGEIYPVNPKRETVQGLTAYTDIGALPETPDTAILALPAAATGAAVEACVARGIPSAVIFSAGFAEAGEEGAEMQRRIAGLAREGGMRLLGPNCLGVMAPGIGWYGTFSVILDNEKIESGPVGIVSQSGAYGSHIAHLARARGMGISQWITTGNELDITMAEALDHVIAQPETRVVMAYAEGVRDGDRLRAALERARDLGKAVVFTKTGRSEVGARAAASHTASLAGSDAVFDAVLRQYGAHRALTTPEQIDVAYAAAGGKYPEANRIGIFTMSGGFGIQLADDCAAAGLDVAPMPVDAQADLKALLPYASPVNPVDATAQAVSDMSIMTAYVKTMMERGGYDMFSAILGAGPGARSFSEPLLKALKAGLQGHEDRILGLTMSAPRAAVADYEAQGFLVFEDGAALANAFGALARIRRGFDQAGAPPAPAPRMDLPEGPLSEAAAKAILARAGVGFPAERLVVDGEAAAAAAAEFGGPVVLKICSPDIAHKTEIGGVALNISGADAARAAAAMLTRVRKARPEARVEGVLVAPMVSGGVETIIGVHDDPSFGPVVMFGLGGIFVEVLKDVTFRAAPFDVAEAHRMIREIRGYPLLEGARGARPADIDALARLLSDLSRFAAAHADRIAGIDLNPVRVMPAGEGVMALDALLVMKGEDA
ncbi:MAG: acetate--CoA ligase family protein [Pikeienuella sp.]